MNFFVSLHAKEYRDSHKESYSEYRERKGAKKTPCLYLVIVGAAFLLPGILFAVLYVSVI